MGNDVQVVNDCATAQVEQVFSNAAVSGSPSLPAPDVGQRVFDRRAFPEFCAPLGRQLPLAQFRDEALLWMDADAASVPALGTAFTFGTRGTRIRWEMHDTTRFEWQLHIVRATNDLPLPVQPKSCLG